MTTATPRSARMTADERRDAIVAAGVAEFATGGLVGASTDAIARRDGVSQPYIFQLFGTKKDLFLAVVRRCALPWISPDPTEHPDSVHPGGLRTPVSDRSSFQRQRIRHGRWNVRRRQRLERVRNAFVSGKGDAPMEEAARPRYRRDR